MRKQLLFGMVLLAVIFLTPTKAQDISWMDSYRVSLVQAHQDKPYSGSGFGNKNGTYYGVYSVGDYYTGFGLGHKIEAGFYGKANFGMSYSMDSHLDDADKFGLNYGAGFGLAASYNKDLEEQAVLKVYYFADLDRIGVAGLAIQPSVRYGNFLVEATVTNPMSAQNKDNKVSMSDISVTYLTKHNGFGIRYETRGATDIGPNGNKVSVNQIFLVFMIH